MKFDKYSIEDPETDDLYDPPSGLLPSLMSGSITIPGILRTTMWSTAIYLAWPHQLPADSGAVVTIGSTEGSSGYILPILLSCMWIYYLFKGGSDNV